MRMEVNRAREENQYYGSTFLIARKGNSIAKSAAAIASRLLRGGAVGAGVALRLLRAATGGLARALWWLASKCRARSLLLLLISLPAMSIFLMGTRQTDWTSVQLTRPSGTKCVEWVGTFGCLAMA